MTTVAHHCRTDGRRLFAALQCLPIPSFKEIQSSFSPVPWCKNELKLSWRLVRHNFTFTFVPPFFFVLGRFLSSSPSSTPSLASIVGTTVYFLLFGYTFDLVNQIMSVEEDMVNKPSRPIPAGLMTLSGAYIRTAISWIIFPFVGYYVTRSFTGVWTSLLWQAVTFIYYGPPKVADTLPGRILFMPPSTVSMLSFLVASTGSNATWYSWKLWILPVWFFCTIHLQDFHDVAGDKASGRKTLPILFPGRDGRCMKLRLICAAIIFGFSAALCGIAFYNAIVKGSCIAFTVIGVIQLIMSKIVAIGVINGGKKTDGVKDDDFNFRIVYGVLFWVIMMYIGILV